jgi:hypothetical protein
MNSFERLVKVFTKPAKPTAKRFDIVRIKPIEPRDITRIFHRCVACDNATHKTQRKRDLAGLANFALVRLL